MNHEQTFARKYCGVLILLAGLHAAGAPTSPCFARPFAAG